MMTEGENTPSRSTASFLMREEMWRGQSRSQRSQDTQASNAFGGQSLPCTERSKRRHAWASAASKATSGGAEQRAAALGDARAGWAFEKAARYRQCDLCIVCVRVLGLLLF